MDVKLQDSTPDLEATFDRVQATGSEVVREPMDQSSGRDCALRDPAGNMIRIIPARG
jgi:predicted enzyme related to lactoylglutathione lyase